MVSRQVVSSDGHKSPICSDGHVRPVSLSMTISLKRLKTVIEEVRNRANVGQEGVVWMEADDLEAITSR